jgi:hypothetical protein
MQPVSSCFSKASTIRKHERTYTMSNSVSETSLSQDIGRYLRHQLRGRRGIVVAAVALGIPALWFGWPWLVVAGLAPILIALAPCAIMCGLGLCAMKACSSSKPGEASSCSKSARNDEAATATSPKLLTHETAARPALAASAPFSPSSVQQSSAEGQETGRVQ